MKNLLHALLTLFLLIPCLNNADVPLSAATITTQIDPNLLKAAQDGDPVAQSDLGMIYYEGKQAPQSDTDAIIWFNKAAAQDGVRANFFLRFITLFPGGVPQRKDIMPRLQAAAKQGDTFAQILVPMMAFFHESPTGYANALAKIRTAAAEGNAMAQIVVDFMQIFPKGMIKSREEATLEILKAAIKGNPLAQFVRGSIGIFATGIPTNDTQIIAKLREAANNDNVIAQIILALMYTNGVGAKQSDEQASALCQKIVKQTSPLTQVAMGVLYASSIKMNLACEQAASWCDKATAVRKDHYNQGVLGRCMLWHKDFPLAQEASTKAHAIAPKVYAWAINLGHAYLLQGDQQKAHAWYEKAVALTKYSWVLQATLADFDLFIKQGWQVEASKTEQAWFNTIIAH